MENNYEGFNDYLKSVINFCSGETIYYEIATKILRKIKECHLDYDIPMNNHYSKEKYIYIVNNYIMNIHIHSKPQFVGQYTDYCEYIRYIINCYRYCNDKKTICEFADYILKINPIMYDGYKSSLIEQLSKNVDDTNYMLKSLPYLNKQLDKQVYDLLLKSGCIDKYFAKSFETDNEKIINIVSNKEIILNNIKNINVSTLYILQDLIGKYTDKNEILLNLIKESFMRDELGVFASYNLFVSKMSDKEIDYYLKTNLSKEEYEVQSFEEMDGGGKRLWLTFTLAERFSKLSEKEYLDKIEEWLNSFKDENINDKWISKVANFREKYSEYKDKCNNNLLDLDDAITKQMADNENNYIKSILVLAGNCDDETKKSILKDFFESGLNNTQYVNIKNREFPNLNENSKNRIINEAINKIFNNEKLVNQIVGGENVYKKIAENGNIEMELQGDYTFLVAAQIKSVERFIKESILHNLNNKTITIGANRTEYTISNKTLDDLNFDDDKVFYTAELGTLDMFLSFLRNFSNGNINRDRELIFENSFLPNNRNECLEYNNGGHQINNRFKYSVFYYRSGRNVDSEGHFHTDFYANFISKVRNGHFHTSMIQTVGEAVKIRNETAFWLLCVINELKGL